MTDMSTIQKYLDYHTTNELLNDTHASEILQMFNDLHTYQYNDVFSTTISINTGRTNILTDVNTIIQPLQILQSFICNDDNHKYKIQVFANDDNKHIHILNCLKEVYFHNSCRKYIIDNNIEHTIIPEIFRYGIIQLPDSNRIISFIEIKQYIDTSSIFIEPDYVKQIIIVESILTIYDQTLSLIKQMETDLNIKLNFKSNSRCEVNCNNPTYIEDEYCIHAINQLFHYKDSVPDAAEYQTVYKIWTQELTKFLQHITTTVNPTDTACCRNIIKYNDKFVIPDFSFTGYTEKTISPRELFNDLV
jgi:hypothetical protein